MKRRKWLIIGAVVLVVAAVIGIIVWNSATAWERDLTVKYIDYYAEDWDGPEGSHAIYEITNNTQRTIRNARAIIHVSNGKWSFDYEDRIGDIHPNETVEYNLWFSDIEDAAAKQDKIIISASGEIARIFWD